MIQFKALDYKNIANVYSDVNYVNFEKTQFIILYYYCYNTIWHQQYTGIWISNGNEQANEQELRIILNEYLKNK
jgi:hypothetical protein